ncbi:MAG: SET domain-containing protein, partial [Methylotetracoccus sp.]|nr:SET domain-containing protein [Methylotetracoccus sp.]
LVIFLLLISTATRPAIQQGYHLSLCPNFRDRLWLYRVAAQDIPRLMYPQLIIELRPSAMLPGEIGLFAVRSIRRGCVIAAADAYTEEVAIGWDRWQQLDPATRRKLIGFCPGDARGIHVPPDLNRLSTPWFCNHGCDPNAGFDAAGSLVARKYIRGGGGDYLGLRYAGEEPRISHGVQMRQSEMSEDYPCQPIRTAKSWRWRDGDQSCFSRAVIDAGFCRQSSTRQTWISSSWTR